MSTQDLLLMGSLLLFVGGPTTLGAAIAFRVAVHGGVAVTRLLVGGAATGLVATAAAFVFISAQSGAEPGVPGFPEISAESLAVETIEFQFEESGDAFIFVFQDRRFSAAEAERLILEAARIGKVKKILVLDTVRHTGGELLQIRVVSETFGLGFEVAEGDLK